MSTSDQQGHGPLTRKQLREIRLTGSTPVITPEEAAAAAAVKAPPVPPLPQAPEATDAAENAEVIEDADVVEDADIVEDADVVEAAPSETAASTSDAAEGAVPLTRRQVRERERSMSGSVPVVEQSDPATTDTSGIDPADDDLQDEFVAMPVSASRAVDSDEVPVIAEIVEADSVPTDADTHGDHRFDGETDHAAEGDAEHRDDDDAVAAVAALGIDVPTVDERDDEDAAAEDDVLADVDGSDEPVIGDGERPTVNSAFGQEILTDPAAAQKPFSPSFDELLTVGDSTGSQHMAPNTLIFNPAPGDGSLSGPVASTGEILVTGSYELPKGLGSQGHAHGTTDGKDIDAVLIDGELAPASSPTPIAASAAVSTIKPAGEIIRPPAPDKGNKLMLILAIVAGGLALALGVALIIAFTTNVF